MTTYYCDMSEATFVDRTGLDSASNFLTGPAGLQAAIRGTGNATALAAGDTLYIKAGTGDLSRLVEIDCGQDMSDWAIEDVVRYDSGASVWFGKVVEVSVGGDDNVLLVWLNDGYDVDDVLTAGGIETLDLMATPVSVATLTAVSAPGVPLEASGSVTAPIAIIGVNAAWTEDGSLVILDGGGLAENGFPTVATRSYYDFRNIHVKNCVYNGWGESNSLRYATMLNCIASGCANGFGGSASYMQYSSLLACKAYDNSSYGFKVYGGAAFGCSAYSNGIGLRADLASLVNCVAYENTTGYRLYNGSSVIGSVADSNKYGVEVNYPGNLVTACRITNNTTYGVLGDNPVHDPYSFYSGNGANFQHDIHDDTVGGDATRTTSGTIGYIDGDNATLADRNYGLTNQAAARRQEVAL